MNKALSRTRSLFYLQGGRMPRKPKKPCRFPGCPNLTDDMYCADHVHIMNARYNKYERPYDSSVRYGAEWRKIRNRYIQAHPLCEMCRGRGLVVAATEVHHKIPLSRGGSHDDENLMSLCKSCHSRITAEMGDRWGKNR